MKKTKHASDSHNNSNEPVLPYKRERNKINSLALCYYSDVVINKPLAVAAANATISISIIIDATI